MQQHPSADTARRLPTVRSLALTILAAAILLTTTTACTPVSVTFTFGGGGTKLEETAVMTYPESARKPRDKVALIDVRGLIADAPRPGLLGAGPSPTDSLAARLERAASDPAVKAVILRVNSPGGSVAGSEVMANEVAAFRAKTGKPVVMSMGEVAASGAYYLALATDHTIAQPTTITGSIGVIIPTINVSGGLSRIGIVSRSVKSGQNKDLANPLEPMNNAHFTILQNVVDEFYNQFRAKVVENRTGRGLDTARLNDLTDGRVFTGQQALDAGLVDELGGIREAFHRAAKLANISSASLVKYHARGNTPASAFATGNDITPQATQQHNAALRPTASASLIDTQALFTLPGAEGESIVPGMAYYLWWPSSPN